MMQNTIRFRYKIPARRMLKAAIAVLGVTGVCAFLALTYSKSLFILGFALKPDQATLFLRGLTAVCGLAALFSVYAATQSHRQSGYVELLDRSASLPRASVQQSMVNIPYSAIRSMNLVQLPGSEQMLTVQTDLGQCNLMSIGFESPDAFSAFCLVLRQRTSV